MSITKRPTIGFFLLAGSLLAMQANLALGASLRSTSGRKTVVRSAVYAAEPEPEEIIAADPVPVVEESYLVEPGYMSPSHRGVPSMAACGPVWSDLRWANFDYLLMFHKGRWFPTLARVSQTGIADAQVVFGEDRVADEPHSGGRLEIGTWLNPCRTWGIGARFVAFADAPVRLNLAAGDFAYIDRPFTDNFTNPPTSNAFVVASPTAQTQGSLDILTNSDIRGFDVFGKTLFWQSCDARIDFVFGYANSRIDENLSIDTLTSPVSGGAAFPTLAVSDVFNTKNEYNAGLIGLSGEYRRGWWGLELFARFGFGNMRQSVSISGTTTSQTSAAPADTITTAGGFLAQPTNSGTWTQDDFSFMEDVGLKLVWYPRERVKVSLGYNLMYWTSVARPGNHIDMQNNSGWFPQTGPDPTTPYPRFIWNPSDLFVHGLTTGVEFTF